MSRIFECKADEELTIVFSLIDGVTGALVSGQAANVGKALRDEDGDAIGSVPVTVEEQGTSGFYEARLTPTKSKPTGHTYLLRLASPPASTDGAILEQTLRVFPTIAVSSVVGSFLTTLGNVKEILGSTGSANDAVLTSLIARISALIEQRLGGRIVQASYQEIGDGWGGQIFSLRQRPVTTFSSLYISQDQVWDSTTLIDPTGYIVDRPAGLVYLKSGRCFTEGFQNVRGDYTAGYVAIPLDVEHYAIKKVIQFFKGKDQMGITTISLKDGSFTRLSSVRELLDDVEDELPAYLQRRVA